MMNVNKYKIRINLDRYVINCFIKSMLLFFLNLLIFIFVVQQVSFAEEYKLQNAPADVIAAGANFIRGAVAALDYQVKIFKSLKSLERKKIIQIPLKLKNFTVELPPQSQKADISCNAAMILAKINNNSPLKLAEILKKYLLLNFKEFESINIAGPGFLNICFHIFFWKKY